MYLKFKSLSGVGYVELVCNKANFVFDFLSNLTVVLISFSVLIPVDKINTFFVFIAALIRSTLVRSADAILYAVTPIFSKKSKLDLSQGVHMKLIFLSLQ